MAYSDYIHPFCIRGTIAGKTTVVTSEQKNVLFKHLKKYGTCKKIVLT